jgi:molybdopterin-guanine dinucleotide biosynthesis protein MobB
MIISICGYQGSGKTTLVEQLIRSLVRKGYRVSSVKHAPCERGVDSKGKDTWRHWQAGSDPVVFSSEIETSIIKHSKTPIQDVVGLVMADYHPDIIVVEGYKKGPFKKVVVGDLRPTEGVVLKNPSLKKLLNYVESEVAFERILGRLPGLDCGKCGHNCEGLARAIVAHRHVVEDCVELSDVGVEIFIGKNKIPTGRFASKVVNDTVRGLMSSLHGYEPNKDVDIHLRTKRHVQTRKNK